MTPLEVITGEVIAKVARKWQKQLLTEPALPILFQLNNSKILSRLGLPDTGACLEQMVSQAYEENCPLLIVQPLEFSGIENP